MRLFDLESDVRWPSLHQWQTAWQHMVVPHFGELTIDTSGHLMTPRGAVPVTVSQGPVLAPRSTYDLDLPNLPSASGHALVQPDGRVEATLRLARTAGEATASFDSLRAPRRFTSRSTLRHLHWHVDVRLDDAHVIDAEGGPDWLTGSVQLTRRGDRLRVLVTVRSAGIWRPFLASFVTRAKTEDAGSHPEESWRVMCEQISMVADDPTGASWPQRSAELEAEAQAREAQYREIRHQQLDAGFPLIEARVRRVTEQVAARHWWQPKGEQAWLEAWDALPPEDWPPTADTVERWSIIEADAARAVAAAEPKTRPAVLARKLAGLRAAYEPAAPTPPAKKPGGQQPEPLSPVWLKIQDADLDLGWLRSPISAMRYSYRRSKRH